MKNGERQTKRTPPDTADVQPPTLRLVMIEMERFKAAFKPGGVALMPFTVLVGRNGSGKSTLIEALQWIDSTLRRDAIAACTRYFGVHDLVNLRSRKSPLFFELHLEWGESDQDRLKYRVRVEEDQDGLTPRLTMETLWRGSGRAREVLIEGPESTDRLALWRADDPATKPVRDYWQRAVFLRLSPSRLAAGSLARRASWEPLLDEEGQNLPALLNELDETQRETLIKAVQSVLPDIEDVSVSKPSAGRNERVHYSLDEKMPYRGRYGRSKFPIPAWMLSEGTRRLTAIFALLSRRPQPTLLCIEEVENGLDPWAVVTLLGHLQSAADAGVQVIVTTHSPWLLDHVDMASIVQVRRVQGETRYETFADRDAIKAYASQVPAGTRYVQETK